MTNKPFQWTTTHSIAGGAYDNLPGGPWLIPPTGIYQGFAIPARIAMRHYADDEVGEGQFTLCGLKLTVRVLETIDDGAGGDVRVFHFLADEFEALMLLPDKMAHIVISFRGSKKEFAKAAQKLWAHLNQNGPPTLVGASASPRPSAAKTSAKFTSTQQNGGK